MSVIETISPDGEIFFPEPQGRKIFVGPLIGNVEFRQDGGIVVNNLQLVKYLKYEEENGLEPANVESLADGRYLVSVRK